MRVGRRTEGAHKSHTHRETVGPDGLRTTLFAAALQVIVGRLLWTALRVGHRSDRLHDSRLPPESSCVWWPWWMVRPHPENGLKRSIASTVKRESRGSPGPANTSQAVHAR